MDQDRFADVAPAIPELGDLNAACGLLWADATHPLPDQYAGFDVLHDGERASFTMQHSPTTYDRLSLFRDADGVWNIEQQRQRPTVETEGFGLFTRVTTTQPLLPGARAVRVAEQSAPHTHDELTPQSVTTADEGLDAVGCQQLLELLRTVRGEEEARQPRFPRVHGWLAKVGLVRG